MTRQKRLWFVVAIAFVFAAFLSQGVPLFDDDFTSWFWKIQDRSIGSLLADWILPVSTQPQYWGFNERPLQALAYNSIRALFGYQSWAFFLYKDIVYAGLIGALYAWCLRLVPEGPRRSWLAMAAAFFFMVCPGPVEAHVLHSDFATTAELWFLVATYLAWAEIERTPVEWKGLPDFSDPAQRSWLGRWVALAVFTYLGYKSKADLKIIPVILALYVLAIPARRKQWLQFAMPIGLMVLLAVPWGKGIFTKLPPFVPGSQGSEIGWMWQPASVERLRDFLWSSNPYRDFVSHFRAPTLSLAALLGPFLLLPLLVFLGWRAEALDKVPWLRSETPVDRARIFASIWFVVAIGAVSALPALNYAFRIRYGIIPLLPVSLLLAWAFGLFEASMPRLKPWMPIAATALLAVQFSSNLARGFTERKELGEVMIAIDRVFEYVDQNMPAAKVALAPDFRHYDYRTDAGPWLKNRDDLGAVEDLAKKNYEVGKTYLISWNPSLWEQLELVRYFQGCRETTVFDHVFGCSSPAGTYLFRYIGLDPVYAEGDKLRAKGDMAGALAKHLEFQKTHPDSLATHFVIGLEAYSLKKWDLMDSSYNALERYFPEHLAILYNHALALKELGRAPDAAKRLEFIVAREPKNYAALINLFATYKAMSDDSHARDVAGRMKVAFPNDPEIKKL
jgi:tetratricopeptide (TPR) repeat protein